MWRQTLRRCAEVLAESAAVLTSVDEDSTVLGEIAATEEGINKLRGTYVGGGGGPLLCSEELWVRK